MTQRVLILKGTALHERASWIERGGKWVCCGATRSMSRWITDLTMQQAEDRLKKDGREFAWKKFK